MSFLPFTRPSIDEATIQGVVEVLRSGWITSGPKVKEFEAALSEYFGGRPVRAFSSGTATLEVALQLCGIGPGDEVITTPMSWVATANVILHAGARPVFVDIDPVTRNIDLDLIEAAITPATRAIIPVDLAGLPVDRDRLYAIALKHKLRVIEDAAQSMGASWHGQRIGSFGDLISFSFHANKNMTTSEGGCLVLNDDSQIALAEKLRLQGVLRAPDGTMDVDVAGGKANLTDIAARIGLGQLPHIDAFTERRRELARHYFSCFDRSLGCQMPPENFTDSNWHMFQILLPLDQLNISRGEFIEQMRQREIGVGVHYPAIHLFTLYRGLGFREGDFPHAEKIGQETVTLPLFPDMSLQDVERVCVAIKEIIKSAHQ
ncbi:MAG: DegT/DnrJ/EryC1/StrS aminotransferase family protein [Gammaproteobacteria bacterium]|nr:DegT/DnrJ/EryC1/StrS aminotransferase family protein [Gammaproteobacteria bacterium]MBU1730709.1 DegT/DnrJ/EryC1/StrS aminotransferase family protein [Gammaproteobacteria bacterium]MBU1893213.1 DegT/DnrJ/EryC1/StrS aminotransferase family protein [Gammaproteobacteria bacterium]